MQLILDAEATKGIQSKMSEFNEEIIDGNLDKHLMDNYSNDLPNDVSSVVKNISQTSDDKEKELLENYCKYEKSLSTNENLSTTDALNITGDSNKEENKISFDISEKKSIEHESSTNEKQAVFHDDIKAGQHEASLDLPKEKNKDLNNETDIQPDEQCSSTQDILKLDSSLDSSSRSMEDDTSRDITNSPDLEKNLAKGNVIIENKEILTTEDKVVNKMDEEAILEDITDNDKIRTSENEVENNMDEDAILEDIADNGKICTLENTMNEDAILDDIAESDKICTLENKAKNNIDEDAILDDIADNDKICSLKNKADNKIDEDAILDDIPDNDKVCTVGNELENNMDEDAILEDIAQDDIICTLKNKVENNIDEDTILEDITEDGKTCTLENEVEKKMDEDTILEDITQDGETFILENNMDEDTVSREVAQNVNLRNLEIEAGNKDEDTALQEVIGNDNISSLENGVNNKIGENLVLEQVVANVSISNLEKMTDGDKILEKNQEEKNKHENEIEDEEKLNCSNDKSFKSNDEDERSLAEHKVSSSRDEAILPAPDKNDDSYNVEMIKKDDCTQKSQEKRELTEMKMPSEVEQVTEKKDEKEKEKTQRKELKKSLLSKLSNTLDILSDDEDEELTDITKVIDNVNNYNQSISLVDDDDVMLIEEDAGEKMENNSQISENIPEESVKTELEKRYPQHVKDAEKIKNDAVSEETSEKNELDLIANDTKNDDTVVKPLLPLNVLKNYKKNLADMTREELEEFCISKIVESVVNRSNLGDIKAQLKITAHAVEEYKKKLMMISKQTRDLQVILKSVQEEQKKRSTFPVTPLKLTRSVGIQVFMTDKPHPKKRQQSLIPSNNLPLDKSNRSNATNMKTQKSNQQIPVPRLVPAATPVSKATSIPQGIANNAVTAKSPQTNSSLVNGLRNSPPAQKPEKRTRVQTFNTVDLTDDEPPSKIAPKSSPTPPVRLVPPQNLMAPQRQPFAPNINSPRKVYIPISSPQTPNIRAGQAYLLKSVSPNPGPRPRAPTNNIPKMQSNTVRMNRPPNYRHPAPLPDLMKQYQPSNWKALPPAPDLKLSKVDNGIVISWKIEGYQDDSYEEISSYQLFAYQETASPPSTALWKKIGDVKALPLPMACTLTQFMAGYKYYFAVRAVDVKSRLGPFSLPGSILLLNKM